MSQIEATLEALKDRSGDAVEAVQQGVEVLGSKLGLVEPPSAGRRVRWMVLGLIAAGALAWVLARRFSRISESDADRDGAPATAGDRRTAWAG